MTARLKPMTAEEVAAFTAGARARRVGGGDPSEPVNEAHYLYWVLDDFDTVVGSIWIGPRAAGQGETFWVWNIEIDPAHRGRGLGRSALLLAERAAAAHGASQVGLNVLGPNHVARRLYESMGYHATVVNMIKPL